MRWDGERGEVVSTELLRPVVMFLVSKNDGRDNQIACRFGGKSKGEKARQGKAKSTAQLAGTKELGMNDAQMLKNQEVGGGTSSLRNLQLRASFQLSESLRLRALFVRLRREGEGEWSRQV